MLRSLKNLKGMNLIARDGEVGDAHDFLFDDQTWTVRYLVADTGSWLRDRKTLVPPEALDRPIWEEGKLPVDMTRERIESAPRLETAQPVSLRAEAAYREHFGWIPYWTTVPGVPPPGGISQRETAGMPALDPDREREDGRSDPHLRSFDEVAGYHIAATDGDIGHVEDVLVDDTTWRIRYLIVDTRNILPGKKVLVEPRFVNSVRWKDSRVGLALRREQIKESPPFDPSKPIVTETPNHLPTR